MRAPMGATITLTWARMDHSLSSCALMAPEVPIVCVPCSLTGSLSCIATSLFDGCPAPKTSNRIPQPSAHASPN
jgi:hypothetical protein